MNSEKSNHSDCTLLGCVVITENEGLRLHQVAIVLTDDTLPSLLSAVGSKGAKKIPSLHKKGREKKGP